MQKPSVGLGIVSYGPQSPRFWKQLVEMTAYLYKDGIEFDRIYHSGVSNTDINRNNVVDEFLQNDTSEWLWWIDADNPPPIGALHRLLALNLPAVSGVYYSGMPEGEMGMIAYVRNQQGAYNSVARLRDFEKGELLQVDAVGMGCFLTHRSVYKDILDQYVMYQRYSGGLIAIRKEDVLGKKPNMTPDIEHQNALKIVDTMLYDPIVEVTHANPKFPFFMCQFGRTEDMHFCELVRGSGHEIWLDTSVEVPHIKDLPITGAHYRANQRQIPDPMPQEAEVV